MDPLTGSLLFAGGSALLGGIGSWFNAKENRKAQSNANKSNYQAQKEFYQNSVGWRVADSKRAGVNPIYGLGADSASFSPSFQSVGNSGIGDALNSVSQAGLAMSQIVAQRDMMEAQTKMYDAEARYKDAQIKTLEKSKESPNSAPSFTKMTKSGLQGLSMKDFTSVENTPYSIMNLSADGSQFGLTLTEKDARQSWMDSLSEGGTQILEALMNKGLGIAGARVYKNRLVLADGSVYDLADIKSSGFPMLVFDYNAKATQKLKDKTRIQNLTPSQRKQYKNDIRKAGEDAYQRALQMGYGE